MKEITQIEFTRQDMLQAWIRKSDITQTEIARALEVRETTVSRWVRAETISTRRHEQLVKLGIPAELLPKPLDITPGPKKKKFLPAIIDDVTKTGAIPR